LKHERSLLAVVKVVSFTQYCRPILHAVPVDVDPNVVKIERIGDAYARDANVWAQ
jgi:hypothetical protein